MKTQTVVVKIPRKKAEREEFSIEKWETGKYEGVTRNDTPIVILTTDCPHEKFPIIGYNEKGSAHTWRKDGKYLEHGTTHTMDLFLIPKQSDGELPKDQWSNVYSLGCMAIWDTEEEANMGSESHRLALLHITYAWEDE